MVPKKHYAYLTVLVTQMLQLIELQRTIIGDRMLCIEKKITQEIREREKYQRHNVAWTQGEEERSQGFTVWADHFDVVKALPFSIDEEKNAYIDTLWRAQRDISSAQQHNLSTRQDWIEERHGCIIGLMCKILKKVSVIYHRLSVSQQDYSEGEHPSKSGSVSATVSRERTQSASRDKGPGSSSRYDPKGSSSSHQFSHSSIKSYVSNFVVIDPWFYVFCFY